jgi:hypothetical protein
MKVNKTLKPEMKTIITALFLTLFCFLASKAQTNMVYGEMHSIFLETPKDWVRATHQQLPYFIKPDKSDVSEDTYMYVYGLDYSFQPVADEWIEANNISMVEAFPDIKIDSLNLKFDNIVNEGYLTGNYTIVTYEYPNKKKEALLAIECRNTIATVVLAAKDAAEFDSYLNAFIELVESLKILNTVLKEE